MDLLKFIKKFTVFKPSPYHEAFFKMTEETFKYNRWYKHFHFNEFQYLQLTKMTEGQTFALASLEGIHIFKKIKFESYQSKENNLTQHNTTEGDTANG